MEERIRCIVHKGKEVVLVDLSNCAPAEIIQLCHLVPTYVTSEPRASVLLLADFTGAKFDKPSVEALKEAAVYDRPHLRRSAWVGADALPHVFYENIKAFTQRELPTFKTREEALDWLVSDEKMASGQ